MTQYGRPTAVVTVGGWTASTGTLYGCASDQSDTTYVIGPTGSTAACELSLRALIDPISSASHVITIRAKVGSGSGQAEQLTGYLYQGTTLIATLAAVTVSRTTITDYTYTLTATEADSITDYSNLRIRFAQTQIGTTEYIYVYETYLSIPDATLVQTTSVNSIIQVLQSSTSTADALLLRRSTNTINADSIFFRSTQQSFTISSQLYSSTGTFSGSFVIDAIVVAHMPVPSQNVYEAAITTSSPDAWWQFKDSVGSSTLTESVAGNNATLTSPSGVSTQSYSGILSGALWSSGYAKNLFYQPSVSSASIEFWINTTATTGEIWNGRKSWIDNSTGGKGISVGLGDYGFGTGAGRLSLFVNSDNLWVSITTTAQINDGKLHHVAAVWSSSSGINLSPSQFAIYIDGTKASTTDYTYNTSAAPLAGNTSSGGSSTFGGFNYGQFSGWIGELAFYNRALTQSEITTHYETIASASFNITIDARILPPLVTVIPDGSFEWGPPTADAVMRSTRFLSITANAWISYVITQRLSFLTAYSNVKKTLNGSLSANAELFLPVSFGASGSITANALLKKYYPYIVAPIPVNAVISHGFTVSARLARGVTTFSAFSILKAKVAVSISVDARIGFSYGFMRHSITVDAYVYKPMTPITFSANAAFKLYNTTKESYFTWDALLFGQPVYTLTADAEIISKTRLSSTTVNAWLFGVYERWGHATLDAWVLTINTVQFLIDARIRKNDFFVGAIKRQVISGSTTVNAVKEIVFFTKPIDATIRVVQQGSLAASASIYPKGYVTTLAWIAGRFTVNAFFKRTTFIASAVVVRKSSGSGSLSADSFLKTSDIIIWPVDGTPPPINDNRAFRIAVKLGVPNGLVDDGKQTVRRTFDWIDITSDVVFSDTHFTQRAKTGPGDFSITLDGTFTHQPGCEIRLEVDDFVQFGGIVSMVEHSYFFGDRATPKTVLTGTDFNVMFDQLYVFNPLKETLGPTHTGAYRPPVTLPVMSRDDDVVRWLINYVQFGDINYTDYVEYVDIANRFDRFFIKSGESLRSSMAALSQTTNAVWYIDALKNLHYHSKFVPSPGIPAITDLGDGVSSSGMRITSDISNMINEDIVWGTLAKTKSSTGVAQGGVVTYAHYISDSTLLIQYAEDTIAIVEELIAKYEALPSLTVKQQELLAMYYERRTWYYQQLAKYKANPTADSRSLYGLWQRGEFRDDLHRQGHVNTRAFSMLYRWDKPIHTVSCTVWEPGFAAGAVARVTSWAHGFQDNLVIREVNITFPAMHGTGLGFPRYDIQLGVEPEAPWNFYDMLPFEGFEL